MAGLDRLVPFSRLTVLMLEAWKQVVPGIEGILGERLAPAGVERLDGVRGLLATSISEDDVVRRARRVALSIQETLEGREPGEMSIEFERDARTVIKMATARQIGVSPRYSILLEAELPNESPAQYPRTLSLGAVVREASTMNLDLVAADRGVSAGEESVRKARSPLFPQFGLSGAAAVIDADRARVLPTLGETQYSATLEASQPIYSDKAWAGYTIESNLQDLRIEERAQLRLDVVLNAGEAYLGLLRAQTIERLQKENLALTRSNLQLASSRVAIGVAGREEMFR